MAASTQTTYPTSLGDVLGVARREMLGLAISIGAGDDDGVASAARKLRDVLASADRLAAEFVGDEHAHAETRALAAVRGQARRWLAAVKLRRPSPVALAPARDRGGGPAALDGAGVLLDTLDLDALELAQLRLRRATLIGVTARRAMIDAADATSARLTKCQFDDSSLAGALFDDATLDNCRLSRAELRRTGWRRASVSRCELDGAALIDAMLDGAVFQDCSFRGADFEIVNRRVARSPGARFVRCDLRETNWRGRELAGIELVDCLLHGAHGAPVTADVVIERPDLSRTGDGSWIATSRDVVAGWTATLGLGRAPGERG